MTVPADTANGLTLTEFIAKQLCSTHVLNEQLVRMVATADGTRIDIVIEHPFPQPPRRIRVRAQLEVVLPDDDLIEAESLDGPPAGAENGAL